MKTEQSTRAIDETANGSPSDMGGMNGWVIDGITVTQAEVRRWMASVGYRAPGNRYWHYVKWYDVPAKIAREKKAGTFESVVLAARLDAGLGIEVKGADGMVFDARAVCDYRDQMKVFEEPAVRLVPVERKKPVRTVKPMKTDPISCLKALGLDIPALGQRGRA